MIGRQNVPHVRGYIWYQANMMGIRLMKTFRRGSPTRNRCASARVLEPSSPSHVPVCEVMGENAADSRVGSLFSGV